MFPLWDVAIAPVLEAAGASRIVEIGALRGETTTRMLEKLGPGAELHVIDPVPDFDPAEHEAKFPGRYLFHRALSLDVLPDLPPMDAALIDGDHNWYTVYHELGLLARRAREHGVPLPVLILHDVGWPYGRRDLYYEPSQIPAEHRQPYVQKGIVPRSKKVLRQGGLNPTMNNAVLEGGPHNGVMTALDDFVAEYDRPLRCVVLPIYFGLAIVTEVDRLERQPELAAALDHLESAEGRHELLEVAEDVRLRAMIFQHNVYYGRSEDADRATKRYLDVVKASLLNEHYLDHEARFLFLAKQLVEKQPLNPITLRDPVRHEQETYRRLLRERTGNQGPSPAAAKSFVPYTAMGRSQLEHLERCLDAIRTTSVPGDLVEVGTGRGGGAIFMRAYLEGFEIPERKVWVADRFRASPEPARSPKLPSNGVAGFQPDLNLVRDGFDRFDLLDDRVRFLQGAYDSSLADSEIDQVALLRIGPGLGTHVRTVLDRLYDKLVPGGFVVASDYSDTAVQASIDAFRSERGITAPVTRVDGQALGWAKGDEPAVQPSEPTTSPSAMIPLAPAAADSTVDLTVAVVFYNMRREAARTLHSLSRMYQEGLDNISYEVIAIENGSSEDQRLGEEFVRSFGPEFRYLDLGAEANPSPIVGLNQAIKISRGRSLALMIDGAHVLTPAVLKYGLVGLDTYEPAIVATQQWYIGPGQQGDAMDDGYDQDYEDRLFEEIRWPTAGYRLFEIGHFVGERDWLDGVWESNCIFVRRSQLEQVGGFDENFSMPGGGYANLELYERLGSAPGVSVCTILGEGSFHQVHGGTTTNQPDATERRARVHGYSEHYADLRGRMFKGPGKPIHYVGRISSQKARRTKPRRMSTDVFATAAAAAHDGFPESPTPVPEELKWAFTEAVWRSLPWTRATWLGRRVTTAPTDLLAYQQLISDVRPDWVLETGTGDGGRALFLASICELVGHGQVMSIGAETLDDLPQHPRLHYQAGEAHHPDTVEAVLSVTGTETRAVLVLGSCTDRKATIREFDAYSPLVPIDSYVVVTDTIVNGHPVWPAFGPGPKEGLKQILTWHGEFVPDPLMEKYSLTFNPGGFLRRVR